MKSSEIAIKGDDETTELLPIHEHLAHDLGIHIDDSDWLDETALILDLDEMMIHTSMDIQELLDLGILDKPQLAHLRNRIIMLDFYNKEGELTDHQMWAIKRPHLDDFLRWAFRTFDHVLVWSAGKEHYVGRAVTGVFVDGGHPDPHAILSRDHCYTFKDDRIKPLDLIYDRLPWLTGRVKRKNMVLLDDKESNFLMNYDRGLLIEPYEPRPTIRDIERDDRQLLDAIKCIQRRFSREE